MDRWVGRQTGGDGWARDGWMDGLWGADRCAGCLTEGRPEGARDTGADLCQEQRPSCPVGRDSCLPPSLLPQGSHPLSQNPSLPCQSCLWPPLAVPSPSALSHPTPQPGLRLSPILLPPGSIRPPEDHTGPRTWGPHSSYPSWGWCPAQNHHCTLPPSPCPWPAAPGPSPLQHKLQVPHALLPPRPRSPGPWASAP